jgi:hypothetical protein
MSDHANVSEVIMLGQRSPKVEMMPPQQRLGELSRRQSGERACLLRNLHSLPTSVRRRKRLCELTNLLRRLDHRPGAFSSRRRAGMVCSRATIEQVGCEFCQRSGMSLPAP